MLKNLEFLENEIGPPSLSAITSIKLVRMNRYTSICHFSTRFDTLPILNPSHTGRYFKNVLHRTMRLRLGKTYLEVRKTTTKYRLSFQNSFYFWLIKMVNVGEKHFRDRYLDMNTLATWYWHLLAKKAKNFQSI